MVDMDALVNELSNNPRYDDSVRRGDNTLTTALLKELEPGKTIFRQVPVAEVRGVLGNSVKGLSVADMQMLNFQVPAEGEVDFSQQGVRDAVDEAFAGKVGLLNKIAAMRSRDRTYGEAFGDQPGLREVRIAVKLVTKSAINTPKADLIAFLKSRGQ